MNWLLIITTLGGVSTDTRFEHVTPMQCRAMLVTKADERVLVRCLSDFGAWYSLSDFARDYPELKDHLAG